MSIKSMVCLGVALGLSISLRCLEEYDQVQARKHYSMKGTAVSLV